MWPFKPLEDVLAGKRAKRTFILNVVNKLEHFPLSFINEAARLSEEIAVLENRIARMANRGHV